MFIPFLNALMNGLFCFVHILHDKPIPVRAIAVNGVWLHGLCAPSVVSTYSVYVGVDIQVDEVAFGQFVVILVEVIDRAHAPSLPGLLPRRAIYGNIGVAGL